MLMQWFLIIFFIFFFVVLGFIVYGFLAMFNPNIRSKWVGRQLRIQKKVLEDNKDTIKDINALGGEVAIDSYNEILDKNGDTLKSALDKNADISKDSIKTVAKAIKDGVKGEIYCKHCGNAVEADSKFCKHCGKRL